MEYDDSLLALVSFKSNGAVIHDLGTLIGFYKGCIDNVNRLENKNNKEALKKKISRSKFNAECVAKELRVFVSTGKVTKIEDLELDRSE